MYSWSLPVLVSAGAGLSSSGCSDPELIEDSRLFSFLSVSSCAAVLRRGVVNRAMFLILSMLEFRSAGKPTVYLR